MILWLQTGLAVCAALVALTAVARARPARRVAVSPAAEPPEVRLARLLEEAHAEQLAFEAVHTVPHDVPARRRAVVARIEQKLHRGGHAQLPGKELVLRVRRRVMP